MISRIEESFEPACPALDVPRLKRKWSCLRLSNCPIPLMRHFIWFETPRVVSCFVSHRLGVVILGYLSDGVHIFFLSFLQIIATQPFSCTHPVRPSAMYYDTLADIPEAGHDVKTQKYRVRSPFVVVELWKNWVRYSFKPWRRGQFVFASGQGTKSR